MAFDAPAPTTADTITAAFRAANMAAPDPAFVREIARRVTPEHDLADVARCAAGEASYRFNTSPWGDFCADLQSALTGFVAPATTSVKPAGLGAFWAALAEAQAGEVRA